jgi:2-polyprenyl-3-methyl-5-hydroxy-6-metoxy-1,4-benzoquinol methylase
MSSLEGDYAARLERLQSARWKRFLDVQAPYAWNLRRLKPGLMLDVGCGVGRSLMRVKDAVGVDPNTACVHIARAKGLEAYTPDELDKPLKSFDSLLIAHVLEHLTEEEVGALFAAYLPYLRPGGQVIMICPQERGFRTDATHVRFLDLDGLSALAVEHCLNPERAFSFPFPRWVGRIFPHAEFVVTARKPQE